MRKTKTLLRRGFQIGFGIAFLGLFPNSFINAQNAQKEEGANNSKSFHYSPADLFQGLRLSDEIIDKRTKNAKHFRNENGNFTAQTGGNYHYKDAAQKWQDIDLNIEKSSRPGYAFQNIKNDAKTFLPINPQNGILLISENGQEFKFWNSPKISFQTAEGNTIQKSASLNKAIVNGYKINYPNIYPNISEEFEILNGGGVENNLIISRLNSDLQNARVGSNVAFQQFIPLQIGSIVKNETGKEIHSSSMTKRFTVELNKSNILYFGNIIVFDNNISKEDALAITDIDPKMTSEMKMLLANSVKQLDYEIKFVNGGIEISYLLPIDWLKNQNRVFPVTIDPTVTFTPTTPSGKKYNPISNFYGFQRTASLYLSSELGFNGTITKIAYNRTNTSGTPADVPTKVYLKTTTATTFTSGAWNSTQYIGGGTLAFNSTLNVDRTIGWKEISLSTPYDFASGNLVIMVNDNYGGTGSGKNYSTSTTNATNRQSQYRRDTEEPADASIVDPENYISEIRFEYFTGQVCTTIPNTIAVNSSTASACINTNFTLSTTGLPSVDGLSYSWEESTDNGVTWTALTGDAFNITVNNQSVETKYRVTVTCTISNETRTSSEISIPMENPLNCYCIPASMDCSNGEMITNVSYQTLNNTTTCSPNGFGDYTALPAPTIMKTLPYPISVTVSPEDFLHVAVWIDYNHNGYFEIDEYTYIGHGKGVTLAQNITVPETALVGETRMRVKSGYSSSASLGSRYFSNLAHPACDAPSFFGETEDYVVNLIEAIDCVTPNAPVISTVNTTVCAGNPFSISAVNDNDFIGITNQWQISIDNELTWTNLTSASNNVTLINAMNLSLSSQPIHSKYRLNATCTLTNETTSSNILSVTNKPADECYCINAIPFDCTRGDVIKNVTFLTTNNSTQCGDLATGHSDYRSTITAPTIQLEETFSISVTVGESNNGWLYESVGVWVDFNNNGYIDSLEGEFFPLGTGINETITGNVTIPADAVVGVTLLRVVCTKSLTPLNIYACGPISATYSFGEMEDYSINIIRPIVETVESVTVSTLGGAASTITIPAGTLQLVSHILPATINQAVNWSIVNGSGAATITNGLVTATQNGNVWGKAVSIEDPTKMDSILIVITNQDLGIKNFGASDLIVYPNPTQNDITLQSNSIIGNVDIIIMDVQGKIIISDKISENEFSIGHKINLANFANGVYILQLNGNAINYKQNIIKQ